MKPRSSHEALANFVPEDEDDDVHGARTAVAVLPDSFLDDLRRGKAEEPTTSRYKVLPEADLEGGGAPPLPPPASRRTESRVRKLNATVNAALASTGAAPPLEVVTASAPQVPRAPILDPPTGVGGMTPPFDVMNPPANAAAPRRTSAPRWLTLVVLVVALLVLGASIGFAIDQ